MFADASTLIHTNYNRVLYLPPLQTFRAFIHSMPSPNFNLSFSFYVLFLQSVIKHSHLIFLVRFSVIESYLGAFLVVDSSNIEYAR